MPYRDRAQNPHPRPAAAHRPPTRSRWAAAGGLAVLTLATGGAGASVAGLALAAPAGAATKQVAVVKETNNTKLGSILVTPSGLTLYRLTTDKPDHPTCTGSCAAIWPPLTIAHQEKKITGGSGVTNLGAVKLSDGKYQVTYHSMPLYRYAGDTSPGQTNGQGIGGTWFVVHPSSSASATSTSATKSKPAGSSGSGGTGGGYSGSGGGY